jgi:uncharacterized protein
MSFLANPVLALVVLVAGILAGFVNVVAGGGSLLSVPALILAGLDATLANGTSRVAIAAQNITAVTRYWRAGRIDTRLLTKLAAPTLIGGVAGAYAAVLLPSGGFRTIFAWVMLGAAVLVVVAPERWLQQTNASPRLSAWLVWPLMLVVGFYGGMIQAAVGYLILAVLTLGLRLPLLEANILKVVLVAIYTPVALAVFVLTGHVNWLWGGLLAVGQGLGAWLGAGAVISRGVALIRAALVIMVVAGALELLGVFDS